MSKHVRELVGVDRDHGGSETDGPRLISFIESGESLRAQIRERPAAVLP